MSELTIQLSPSVSLFHNTNKSSRQTLKTQCDRKASEISYLFMTNVHLHRSVTFQVDHFLLYIVLCLFFWIRYNFVYDAILCGRLYPSEQRETAW